MPAEEDTDCPPAGVTESYPAVTKESVTAVADQLRMLCRRYAANLPFHGWHHLGFVREKAVEFAERNGAEVSIVETAALVHDLNYLVRRNSPASTGSALRMRILHRAKVGTSEALWIDRVVDEAEMRTRGRHISIEAQALSDADTLFKALPVTPVVLAHRYLAENQISLRELADKIVGEQHGPLEAGFYFYDSEAASTYSRWAGANLRLWHCIRESLDDPAVVRLLDAVG